MTTEMHFLEVTPPPSDKLVSHARTRAARSEEDKAEIRQELCGADM